MPMDISELKSKKIIDLYEIAKQLDLQGYTDLRKQDLIFKILEAQTTKDGLTFQKVFWKF
ncbi:MAG: Rho termination factor N-terminal domain-containing protein [Melioribacteraceae bacterium]|nr:Rho termination factor N-terminal domain-containing protein [Melioribacteraceae bacterium]